MNKDNQHEKRNTLLYDNNRNNNNDNNGDNYDNNGNNDDNQIKIHKNESPVE